MSEFSEKLELLIEKFEAARPLLDWIEANKTELQGVMDGTHKISPIRPTPKMIDAGKIALENAQDLGCYMDSGGERFDYTYFIVEASEAAIAVYLAMMDAVE